MYITRETDYAIRCVYYLAGKKNEVIMVDEIAREMYTPKSFLSKVLQKLARAGLVKSFRGVKGGFQLARPPSKISLLDIIEAIQGPVAMNICALDKKSCDLSHSCAIHPVWVDIRKKVEKLLRSKKISKLKSVKREYNP